MNLFRLFTRRAAQRETYVRANRQMLTELMHLGTRAYDRRVALEAIAACETAGANATVRRMAKIARDCLAKTNEPVDAIGEPVVFTFTGGGGGGGGAREVSLDPTAFQVVPGDPVGYRK